MRLSTKLAAFLVVLAVVLGGGVFGAFEAYKQRAVEQERSRVKTAAVVTAGGIERDVRSARATLASRALRADSLDDLTVRSALSGPNAIGVHVVAANGTIVEAYGRTGVIGAGTVGSDVGNESYVTEALKSKSYVSDPVWLADRGRYAVVVSAPVFANGLVVGVAATTRYLNARSALADERLTVYVRNTSRERAVPARESTTVPETLAASARVEETGWTIVVRKDTTALRERLDRLLFFQMAGVAGVVVLVGAFAFWQYRGVISQIRSLGRGFRALREGDYAYRLSLSGSDEWPEITDGYDHMASELAARERKIRENEERLQVLNRILRHNVRNRMGIVVGQFENIKSASSSPTVQRHAEEGMAEVFSITEMGDKARQVESVLASADEGLTTTDLVPLVERVVASVGADYPAVTIETRLPDRALVRAVPALEPPVVDAVDNACRHNDSEDPHIRVEVTVAPETVTLAVVDDGSGFPEQERHVVEKGMETSLEHGSGLGLWLIRWSVEKSGGSVEIDDEEGKTTLRLRFRRATEA